MNANPAQRTEPVPQPGFANAALCRRALKGKEAKVMRGRNAVLLAILVLTAANSPQRPADRSPNLVAGVAAQLPATAQFSVGGGQPIDVAVAVQPCPWLKDGQCDPNGDADGDGCSNHDEWLGGTDPFDASSHRGSPGGLDVPAACHPICRPESPSVQVCRFDSPAEVPQ
jgi:hypothetical protein